MPKYKATPEAIIETAMHMAVGLQHAISTSGYPEEVADEVGGFTGLVATLAPYATQAEQLLEHRNPEDFPGVYAYEVAEEFGAWFGKFCAEHRRVPTPEEGASKLEQMDEEFFRQSTV